MVFITASNGPVINLIDRVTGLELLSPEEPAGVMHET